MHHRMDAQVNWWRYMQREPNKSTHTSLVNIKIFSRASFSCLKNKQQKYFSKFTEKCKQ